MTVPPLVRHLANGFAIGALPAWWWLDPTRALDAPASDRAAWEARVEEAWRGRAEAVEAPMGHDLGRCEETGFLGDGLAFPSLDGPCSALQSTGAALRECGFGSLDRFGFAMLVRSDSEKNRVVVRSGDEARDACAERALERLPLADHAPPRGALLGFGTAFVPARLPDPATLGADGWDKLLTEAWEAAVADVRVPPGPAQLCSEGQYRFRGYAALCEEVSGMTPELRECGFVGGQRVGFALKVRGGAAENEAVVRSGDPARDACAERWLRALPLADRVTPGGAALAYGETSLSTTSDGMRMFPMPDRPREPMAYGVARQRETTRVPVTVGIVADLGLVGRVHDLVECPSERPGTWLEATWRGGALTVETAPPVPCVEERVRARATELLDLLAAAVDPDDDDYSAGVAAAGPPRGWPGFHLALWLVLPELTP